jgi:DNA-directed RNA polymerase subunit alpha
MVKPIDLKISTVKETADHGVFSFEPLPKGYGHTVGNILRRVLLTSVEGSAITQVTVKGVEHQFSTLAGVKEDVVAITLNLKNIRFKNYAKEPVVATLSVSKEGLVTAGSIECPSDLEVINKDAPIATITKKGTKLEMEFLVENGFGYSPSEERETSKVGVIMLDALYTPVLAVSYDVESARFGKTIDLDKVVLTVDTDGSISPKEAVILSAKLIKGFFERLIIWDETPKGTTEETLEMVDEAHSANDENAVSVDDMPLPTRTINALKKANILTMNDLLGKTEEDLLDIKNVGQKSIDELLKLIEEASK